MVIMASRQLPMNNLREHKQKTAKSQNQLTSSGSLGNAVIIIHHPSSSLWRHHISGSSKPFSMQTAGFPLG